MGLFGHKGKTETRTYDKENQVPAIRASICTGEQVAGFRDIRTGKFEDVMLIKNGEDLQHFKKMYQIEGDIKKFF